MKSDEDDNDTHSYVYLREDPRPKSNDSWEVGKCEHASDLDQTGHKGGYVAPAPRPKGVIEIINSKSNRKDKWTS